MKPIEHFSARARGLDSGSRASEENVSWELKKPPAMATTCIQKSLQRLEGSRLVIRPGNAKITDNIR